MAARQMTRFDAGAGGPSVPLPEGLVFSPKELGDTWKLSEQSVRRLFQDRPGVFKLGDSSPKGKRSYQTLRIPKATAEAVWRERTK